MAYQVQAGLSDAQRLIAIDQMVGEMHGRLFGNGQPGELEKLGARVAVLEKWFWRCTGAAGFLFGAAEIFKAVK